MALIKCEECGKEIPIKLLNVNIAESPETRMSW